MWSPKDGMGKAPPLQPIFELWLEALDVVLTVSLRKPDLGLIIRVRINIGVAPDARSFRAHFPTPRVKKADREKDGIVVVSIAALTTYGQYGEEEHKKKRYQKDFQANPINYVIFTPWKRKDYPPGKEKIFITNLSVDDPLQIINYYGLRSFIEKKSLRELKQGWMIGRFLMKTEAAACSHTLLILAMYSLNACFQTQRGKELAQKGIRRLIISFSFRGQSTPKYWSTQPLFPRF